MNHLPPHTHIAVDNNKACDVSNGEVYLSTRKAADLAACKKSCEDSPKCVSITYWNGGGCDPAVVTLWAESTSVLNLRMSADAYVQTVRRGRWILMKLQACRMRLAVALALLTEMSHNLSR